MKKLMLMAAAVVLMSASSASFAYGYYNHGYYHHGYYGPRVGVIIGGPWGPPPPVYYTPPPVVYVTPPAPQTYVEKTPSYVYYCPHPAGYYPQIPRCPSGWMKVVPGDSTPR